MVEGRMVATAPNLSGTGVAYGEKVLKPGGTA